MVEGGRVFIACEGGDLGEGMCGNNTVFEPSETGAVLSGGRWTRLGTLGWSRLGACRC